MNIGMMWFDNDPKASTNEKVGRAVEYYEKKYGRRPNLCFVHPSQPAASGAPVEVRSSKQLRPNNFWLGVDEKASVENS